MIIKIANANNNNNNKNENNNNNNDNNNNNVHEQTFLKINDFDNMYGMMFVGAGREFPDFPDYPDYPNYPEKNDRKRNESVRPGTQKLQYTRSIKQSLILYI